MKVRDWLAAAVGRTVVAAVRLLILHLPDWLLALKLRALAWLIFLFTGSRAATGPVTEMAEVFACGPPFTDTVRKLLRGAEPEVVSSSAKCLSRPSPYGAP
jgi:hypothetical protein